MTLPKLSPDLSASPVPVQETEFSYDVLGRYVCNSWDEVSGNGGDPFDVVVIGGGMFGGYIADKLYRYGEDTGVRVLVLEAGAFLVSTHVQNLPRVGLGSASADTPAVTDNTKDPGPSNLVWGFPWHSHQRFPGLAYCVGGRSVYWGGWSPRMIEADLDANWPADVAAYLKANYLAVEKEIGVKPTTDYISGPLFETLLAKFRTAAPADYVVDEAPLAIQGKADASGLFAFDKYSSAYLLIDAVREDIARRGRGEFNNARRLMMMPRAHVTKLFTSNSRVTGVELFVNGRPRFIEPPLIGPNTKFVVATSTVESTRLAMESFRTPLMGANLMAHLRSNITVRVKRTTFGALPQSPQDLEAAALIVRGTTSNGRRFHLQVSAASIQGSNPEQNMFSAIPDIDQLDRIRANQDGNWVVITLRAIGETIGDKRAKPGDQKRGWIDLAQDDPLQKDRFGKRAAWVNLEPSDADMQAWTEIEQKALALARDVAGNPSNLQYWYGGKWHDAAPSTPLANGDGRDNIGSTHHECGTLWMGPRDQSVTDSSGRFHHIDNAYVAGPALFPAAGSANPSLTGMTMARKTASAIVENLKVSPGQALRPIFTGTLTGWQMAGGGGFQLLDGGILETQGGLGLLWYKREIFRNFVLKVDWLSFNPAQGSSPDNSGVFLRFPALNASDAINDWKLAVDKGYEIQIDDTGFNPDTNSRNDPRHQTGAVYTFAPSSRIASKPAGQWNTFEIQAKGDRITVTLNGQLVTDFQADGTRPRAGHVGLQNHTGRVQFRNILVQPLPD